MFLGKAHCHGGCTHIGSIGTQRPTEAGKDRVSLRVLIAEEIKFFREIGLLHDLSRHLPIDPVRRFYAVPIRCLLG